MEYTSFLRELQAKWRQGEHLTIIAPTRAGKTWLAADVLQARDHVVILATKKQDDTYKRFQGYRRQERFSPEYPYKRYFVWKRAKELGDVSDQRQVMWEALKTVYDQHNWCLYADDLVYHCDNLHLVPQYRMMYTQGGSEGITLVASLQRPRRVPTEAVNQASHVLMLRGYDDEDVVRIGQGAGQNRRDILDLNRELSGRSFIWMQNRAGVPPVLVVRPLEG